MADTLQIAMGNRESKYTALLSQIVALTSDEPDLVANCANITAALKQTFGFFWIGFYFVKGGELVLGPFQGDLACTRIAKGKGVCGTCWEKGETILVADVDLFPGHIACSALSRSEIVVPVIKAGVVRLVLDIDSDTRDDFDQTDKLFLEQIALHISKLID